jgi:hypothetical protein
MINPIRLSCTPATLEEGAEEFKDNGGEGGFESKPITTLCRHIKRNGGRRRRRPNPATTEANDEVEKASAIATNAKPVADLEEVQETMESGESRQVVPLNLSENAATQITPATSPPRDSTSAVALDNEGAQVEQLDVSFETELRQVDRKEEMSNLNSNPSAKHKEGSQPTEESPAMPEKARAHETLMDMENMLKRLSQRHRKQPPSSQTTNNAVSHSNIATTRNAKTETPKRSNVTPAATDTEKPTFVREPPQTHSSPLARMQPVWSANKASPVPIQRISVLEQIQHEEQGPSKRMFITSSSLAELKWEAELWQYAQCNQPNAFLPKPLQIAVPSTSDPVLHLEVPQPIESFGTLHRFVEWYCTYGTGAMPEAFTAWLVLEMLNCVSQLHQAGISHNHLTLSSFLLCQIQDGEWRLMVTGLGKHGVRKLQEDTSHYFLHDRFSMAALVWFLLTGLNDFEFIKMENEEVRVKNLYRISRNAFLLGKVIWAEFLRNMVNISDKGLDQLRNQIHEIASMRPHSSSRTPLAVASLLGSLSRSPQLHDSDAVGVAGVPAEGLGISPNELILQLRSSEAPIVTPGHMPTPADSTPKRDILPESISTAVECRTSMGPDHLLDDDRSIDDSVSRTFSTAEYSKKPVGGSLPARTPKRRLSQSDPVDRAKRPKRSFPRCGKCKKPWGDDKRLMWMLVHSFREHRKDKSLPNMPQDHPAHLLCHLCCTRIKGEVDTVDPERYLTRHDKKAMRNWNEYLYYSGTKVDYENNLRL